MVKQLVMAKAGGFFDLNDFEAVFSVAPLLPGACAGDPNVGQAACNNTP